MEVSNKVASIYQKDSITKYISVYFPELDKKLDDEQIESESMTLTESISSGDNIEFVGCISSIFTIQARKIDESIKGKKIVVTICTEGTEDEPIPLFSGIVDSAPRQNNKRIRQITAYDELYTKGNKQVSEWYKSLTFPITLKGVRDSLFDYIGLEQVETDLPNDNIEIKKQYNPSTLQALSVIKAICQINGAFGIINRQGEFEYRILGNIEDGLYPGFYPGPDAYPGVSKSALGLSNINSEELLYWENLESEDYKVKPVDKITIRQSEDEDGVSYSSGDNNYVIQGNMFTYGLSDDVLLQIAENIYPNVQGFSYIPFTSKNNGLPFLECGLDAVTYNEIDWDETENSNNIVYKQSSFYILNRDLTGIQALKDSYSANGEEYQNEFVSNLQEQIDLIKKKQSVSKQDIEDYVQDYTYDKEYIDNLGGEGSLKALSVKSLPTNPDIENTIYFIQGEVFIQ